MRRRQALGLLATSPSLLPSWDGPDGRRLDEQELAGDAAQVEGFRWQDRRKGAPAVLPGSNQRAHALVARWRCTPDNDPLRPHLAYIAGDLCHLVGYQLHDQGRLESAAEWMRAAGDLAAQARHKDLYVFATVCVASMATKMGRPDHALSLLHQTAQMRRLSASARAYIAVYQACAHARQRCLSMALSLLDDADRLSGQAGGDQPSSWLGVSDGQWVSRQRAIIQTRAGLAEAIPILTQLRDNTPGIFARYHANVSTDLAACYATSGDAERATTLLMEAIRINESVDSARRYTAIRSVRRHLEPHRALVAQIDDALRPYEVSHGMRA